MTLILMVAALAATALVTWWVRPESAVAWIGVVGGTLGPAGLWLAWSSYRDDRADNAAAGPTPADVADLLADAVREQWVAEAVLRRLNDPYALPVEWGNADGTLVEDWLALVRLATTDGVGWPVAHAQDSRWATSASDLAGKGNELIAVLDRVPTGRLVVLGEPGAGKTILLVRLILDLTARRASGDPVPVLVPLASWNPTGQGLYEWLTDRLIRDYPALAEPGPAGRGSRAQVLLEEGLVLPLLDGLDEIPEALRSTAVARINESARPGQRLVLATRTRPYRDAIFPTRGAEVRLTGAAGIEVLPLDAVAVADYLRASAGGSAAAARWDRVLVALSSTPPPPVAQALAMPLMVALARAVYNPRPGEPEAAIDRHPVELLDTVRFPTTTSVEQHLFDAFVTAAYRPRADPTVRRRWSAADAERWLIFLARHLEHDQRGNADLVWWQLPAALSPRRPGTPRLVFTLIGGLAGVPTGWVVGGPSGRLAAGLLLGLLSGFMFWLGSAPNAPARAIHWDRALVLMLGFMGGAGFAFAAWSTFGAVAGVSSGIAGAIALPSFIGMRIKPISLAVAVSPSSVLLQDRTTFRALFAIHTFSSGLIIALTFGIFIDVHRIMILAALGCAPSIGLWSAFARTAYGRFGLARLWLAFQGRLPMRLMAFLIDAHQRGVLRQVGAVYQFRHIELQRHLANR